MIEPPQWQLRYYQTAAWRMPFREWQESLGDGRSREAIRNRLRRLQRGLFGDCEPVGEGVFEMRIDLGPGYRGYFCRAGKRVILLLCGGDKRTQGADIERAKKYRRDYEKRTGAGLGSG